MTCRKTYYLVVPNPLPGRLRYF